MQVEISNGELLDKLSILQIKLEKISDPIKRINVQNEYDLLRPLCEQLLEVEEVNKCYQELLEVNKTLWNIEDDIRSKERTKTFDATFIVLARSVYYTNDERAYIKREINKLTRSRLVEEKSYDTY